MRAPHGQSAAAAAAGQPPLTYKEYKARKAAEAAARGN